MILWLMRNAVSRAYDSKPGLAAIEFEFCPRGVLEYELARVAALFPCPLSHDAVLKYECLTAANGAVSSVSAILALRHNQAYDYLGGKLLPALFVGVRLPALGAFIRVGRGIVVVMSVVYRSGDVEVDSSGVGLRAGG